MSSALSACSAVLHAASACCHSSEPPINQVLTQPTAALCRLCVRLFEERALLVLEYDAAADALAATPRSDGTYVARWTDLATLSERLYQLERRERLHQQNHGKA
jgi:hypothetical protein